MRTKLSCIEKDDCGYVEYVWPQDMPERLLCPSCYRILLVDHYEAKPRQFEQLRSNGEGIKE